MSATYTLAALADLIGGTVRGDSEVVITGVADVEEAGPHDAAWVAHSSYASKLGASRAGVVLVPVDFGPTPIMRCLSPVIRRSRNHTSSQK